MAWLRSPLLYGGLLLFIGVLLRAAWSTPEAGRTMTADELRRALEFQRAEQPILKLEPRYRPYSIAFILAGSEAEMAAIKQAIDGELAATAAVRERGLAGLAEYTATRLVAVDLVLMALGAALMFRSLAFVLAVGFAAGLMHQLVDQASTLTGAPSEFYLAAILAALVWSALFWAIRALYEGRLGFSGTKPPQS
ncbi:MAG: hypothetical protein ACREIP_01010 [Alphaproteobacteria bacterium]